MCKHWTVLRENKHPCFYGTHRSYTFVVLSFLPCRACEVLQLWSLHTLALKSTSAAPRAWSPQAPPDQPSLATSTWGLGFFSRNGCGTCAGDSVGMHITLKVSNKQFHHRRKQHSLLWICSAHEWETLLPDPLCTWLLTWWEHCTAYLRWEPKFNSCDTAEVMLDLLNWIQFQLGMCRRKTPSIIKSPKLFSPTGYLRSMDCNAALCLWGKKAILYVPTPLRASSPRTAEQISW